MTKALTTAEKRIHVLLVDDSPIYRAMILRDLMHRGFTQTGETVLSRGNLDVHMIDNYLEAMAHITSGSSRHVNLTAAFLDWHLSPADRSAGYDGVQLAIAALDPINQPFNPAICCVSGDVKDMIVTLRAKVNDPVKWDRIIEVDFIEVVSKIIEITSAASPPPVP